MPCQPPLFWHLRLNVSVLKLLTAVDHSLATQKLVSTCFTFEKSTSSMAPTSGAPQKPNNGRSLLQGGSASGRGGRKVSEPHPSSERRQWAHSPSCGARKAGRNAPLPGLDDLLDTNVALAARSTQTSLRLPHSRDWCWLKKDFENSFLAEILLFPTHRSENDRLEILLLIMIVKSDDMTMTIIISHRSTQDHCETKIGSDDRHHDRLM
jgi:hypothetical protein